MSELDNDLDLVQARQRGDAVLLTDATTEGDAIGAALRGRGFDVADVPLPLLETRVALHAPRVVIVDIDEEGALAAIERLHQLAEGAATTVLLVGDPVRSAELDPHLFSQVFERPVDLAELTALVSSVAEPMWSDRAHGTTPPPSFAPRGVSGAPAPMDSEAPSNPDFSGELDPIDVGSVLPGADEGESLAPRLFPARLSPELEQLLAAAERRVTAKARPSSIPSVEDEVDLILSPELLSALDEPLEPEDEGPRTGSGSGIGTGTPLRVGSGRLTPGSGTHGLAASVQTIGERVARAVEPTGPRDLPPWTGPPPPPEPEAVEHATRRAGSDHEALQLHRRAPSERPLAVAPPPDGMEERWSAGTRNEEEPRRTDAGPGRAADLPSGHAAGAPARPAASGGFPLTPAGLPASSPHAPSSPLASPRWAPEREHGAPTQRELDRARREPDRDRGGASYEGHIVSPPREVEWRSFPEHRDGGARTDHGSEPSWPRGSDEGAGSYELSLPADPRAAMPPGALPLTPVSGVASLSGPGYREPRGAPGAFAAPAAPPGVAAPGVTAPDPAPQASAAEDDLEPAVPSIATVLGPGDAPRALARAVGSRASGSLSITTEAGARRIVLHDGDLVTAGSAVPEETLLSFLAARGDIERDVAVRLSGKLPASGRHAGAALIANGHLGQDDLWPVLRSHAEWLIGHVVLIEGGTCELEAEPPGRLKAEPNVFGGATGAEVFVETVRRVIAPEAALRRLGGHAARLDDGVRRALLNECALPREEDDVIRAARGRSVGEIIGAAEPEMASVLYALVCLEVLDVLIPPAVTEAPAAPVEDPLDEEAIRRRVRARLALVEDGDYFTILGIPRDATSYEIRRAYLALRRAFEPSTLLTAATVDLLDEIRLVIEVLDEAYDILREPHRRERYRRAIGAEPP